VSEAAVALSALPPVGSRRRQLWSVVRHELRRGLSLRRGLWLLLLAFAPAFIILMHAIGDHSHPLEEETQILAVMIQLYFVRFGIFFGCLGLAVRLVRGEVAEKTLHYPFLVPIRRETLLVGKYLAGAASAVLVFGTGVLATFTLMCGHHAEGVAFVTTGDGLRHLAAYLAVTVLACLGYLSALLVLSLLVKNPMVPAALLVVWEGINGFMPPWLQHLSVTYYLKPLFPVTLPLQGLDLLMVPAEPTPTWLAVIGLLAFSAVAVSVACWRLRRFEISYSTD
jgi:ABC-type transport system involved in multi-copper enzyme maturation permease subunit